MRKNKTRIEDETAKMNERKKPQNLSPALHYERLLNYQLKRAEVDQRMQDIVTEAILYGSPLPKVQRDYDTGISY